MEEREGLAIEKGEGRGGGGEGGREEAYFAGFILCDFVLGVFLAVFALAVGAAGFGDVDLGRGDGVLARCSLGAIWLVCAALCEKRGALREVGLEG